MRGCRGEGLEGGRRPRMRLLWRRYIFPRGLVTQQWDRCVSGPAGSAGQGWLRPGPWLEEQVPQEGGCYYLGGVVGAGAPGRSSRDSGGHSTGGWSEKCLPMVGTRGFPLSMAQSTWYPRLMLPGGGGGAYFLLILQCSAHSFLLPRV